MRFCLRLADVAERLPIGNEQEAYDVEHAIRWRTFVAEFGEHPTAHKPGLSDLGQCVWLALSRMANGADVVAGDPVDQLAEHFGIPTPVAVWRPRETNAAEAVYRPAEWDGVPSSWRQLAGLWFDPETGPGDVPGPLEELEQHRLLIRIGGGVKLTEVAWTA